MAETNGHKATEDPQLHMDEIVIEDDDLLQKLRRRLELKVQAKELREIDKYLKAEFPQDKWEGKVARIGEFRISPTVAGEVSDVAFTRQPTYSLNVKMDPTL